MRVLVIGGTGLIGGAVVARLIDAGCGVVGIARRTGAAARSVPAAQWVSLDIAAARLQDDWVPYLAGIDVVVNCAGVPQDSPNESTRAVHVEGITALFAACERLAVRRVVHFFCDRCRPRGADPLLANQDRGRPCVDEPRPRLGDPAPVGRGGLCGLWRQRAIPRACRAGTVNLARHAGLRWHTGVSSRVG